MDAPWNKQSVEMNAVFSGLKVTVDGEVCEQMAFVSEKAAAHTGLGCKIKVREGGSLNAWQNTWRQQNGFGNVLVNFHGQVVDFNYRPTSDYSLCFLVDMTGEPTDTVCREGLVRVRLTDGTEKRLAPPEEKASAAA